jgi:hypothetical protein
VGVAPVCHAPQLLEIRVSFLSGTRWIMSEAIRIFGDGSGYVGKRLLIGITYQTKTGTVLREEQYHGYIIKAGEGGIIVERADTGEQISLPPILQPAEPGQYRLSLTGEVVVDPDYFAKWTCNTESDQPEGTDL